MSEIGQISIVSTMQGELTRERAELLCVSGWWNHLPKKEAALLQLNQKLLCMPELIFLECVGCLLNRPFYKHELTKPELIFEELVDGNPLSLSQIVAKIPKDKMVYIHQ